MIKDAWTEWFRPNKYIHVCPLYSTEELLMNSRMIDILAYYPQIADLNKKLAVTVTTSEANGHEHKVVLRYEKNCNFYYIAICDDRTLECDREITK